jgi:predicted small integral membrane protein
MEEDAQLMPSSANFLPLEAHRGSRKRISLLTSVHIQLDFFLYVRTIMLLQNAKRRS